jgi:hypothetical protein
MLAKEKGAYHFPLSRLYNKYLNKKEPIDQSLMQL